MTAGVEIAPLDPRDDESMRTWHDCFLASHRHERPYAVPLMREEVQADLAVRHGYSFAPGNVQRVLELPADDARLTALAQEAAPHHRDYTLRSFSGAVPDDLVSSFADIVGTLTTEAPSGEIAHEPEVFGEARIRAVEQVGEFQQRL